MTRTEQVEYFKTGLEFLKTEYPTFHIVDSRIHYDEQGLPHMHTSMLPIHVKADGTKNFNISQHQKGKDAERFAHLVVARKKPGMSKNLLWQWFAQRHKHDGPVDCVETQNVFADNVHICRPVLFVKLAAAVYIVAKRCDIV